jgi:hypothetical protein
VVVTFFFFCNKHSARFRQLSYNHSTQIADFVACVEYAQVTLLPPPNDATAEKKARAVKGTLSCGRPALTSYNLFCSDTRGQIRRASPQLLPNEVEKLLGQQWRSKASDERRGYADRAKLLNSTPAM